MQTRTYENLFTRLSKKSNLRRFLLFKLPLAFLAGARMVSFSRQQATIAIKRKWINRNIFRTRYSSAMNMGAELTCGLLLYSHIHELAPNVGMMLEEQSGIFEHEAGRKVFFVCLQGDDIRHAVEAVYETANPTKLVVKVYATDEVGAILATFVLKWKLAMIEEAETVPKSASHSFASFG